MPIWCTLYKIMRWNARCPVRAELRIQRGSYSGERRRKMTPTDRYPLGRAERRRHRRFPTVIDAKWIADGIRGTAAVHNLSSGGVFLKPERVMSIGAEITVVIDWPAAVSGRGSLALVIEGRV